MKPLLFFLFLSSTMVLNAHAHEARFFIGTYNTPDTPGIFSGTLDTDSGRLSALCPASRPEDAQAPSFLALSPDGRFLYACLERKEGAVAAFRVESGGALAFLNVQPSGGAATCHVSASEKRVFAASYSSGSFAVFERNGDGSLQPHGARIELSGSGPNPRRQAHSFAHSLYPVDGGAFVYGCDLGGDKIECYRGGEGNLTSIGPARTPAGAGPRHLAFSGDGKFVYCCNELASSLSVFSRDPKSGALSPLQTLPVLPEGEALGDYSAAEIALHPGGGWLYVSIRDTAKKGRDRIAVFKIDAGGLPKAVELAASPVRSPRGFDIDPTGRWLLVAGEADHRLALLAIDAQIGTLSPSGACLELHAPVCVLFAR
ncbi:MAG: lactonase family protein [Chthoniobacteraceae bacterium]